MNDKFYPSINGIYFKNFDMIEDIDGIKHIRGDLYYCDENQPEEQCIGYYNPLYQANQDDQPQCFLRIDEDFRYLYDTEKRYESIFNTVLIPLAEYDCLVGLQELIFDLELITCLYEFMRIVSGNDNLISNGAVGIINGSSKDERTLVTVIQFKDPNIMDKSNESIIDTITKNVTAIKLNQSYPIRIFRNTKDFTIYTREGVVFNVVQ